MTNTTTIGVSRDSLEAVERSLEMYPKGLNVSEISRACGDLSRHTVYRALEILGADRDTSFYPPTYTLPGVSPVVTQPEMVRIVRQIAFSVTGSEEQAHEIAYNFDQATN